MSQSESAPVTKDKTFVAYSKEQGKAYAQFRLNYNTSVYEAVLGQHTSTGGQLDTLIDVGCGPGMAAYSLASHFNHAIGLDPSKGMIDTARSMITEETPNIRFEVSSAEDLGEQLSPPIAAGSVDLITASTAAHWFDMDRFWPAAARVLKPGGTVALWVSGETGPHPDLPNSAAIETSMAQIREEHLLPFFEPGNLLAADLYADLPLPWTLEKPVGAFDEASFFRREWTRGEKFFSVQPEVDMDVFEKIMSTVSPVTRWREAHPEAVGTEKDVVRMQRREIERLLQEAGVEKGHEKIRGMSKGALLCIKKKKE